ncbi:DUF6643 family protein [Streptomyces thermoviolaceus]|uniref:DUF6643 family protein n=1 Tax=Streptomyces thermoviolaceus TaxID=1952 RepID=UPI0033B7CB2C
MTSPRSTYGGYYSASFPETPIYDSLVAERGTPQIAPIRVPAPYDTGSHLPALPSAAPALPAPAAQPAVGYPQASHPAPLQQAPAPHIPQQPSVPRGYPGPQQHVPPRPVPGGAGYEAMRPAAPRPAPAPYQDPYQNQQYRGY